MKYLVIPGAQKAGTTSVYNGISQHPDCQSVKEKDTNFFISANEITTERYDTLFDGSKSASLRCDVCGNYYWNSNVPERIQNTLNSAVRVVFMVRNPFDRAFSAFHHEKKTGRDQRTPHEVFDINFESTDQLIEREHKNLERAMDEGKVELGNLNSKLEDPLRPFLYVQNSLYSQFIKNYTDVFGRDNVKVMFLEQLRSEPNQFYRELFSFLGIDSSFTPDNINVAHNKTRPSSTFLSSLINRLKPYVPSSLKNMSLIRSGYERLTRQKEQFPTRFKETYRGIFQEEIETLGQYTEKIPAGVLNHVE